MEILKALNLALRFGLELCLLTAVGYGGYKFGANGVIGALLALLFVLAVATIWGMFIAPKAKYPLPVPKRMAVEIILFAIACVLLATSGKTGLALAFAIAVAANELLLVLWKQ